MENDSTNDNRQGFPRNTQYYTAESKSPTIGHSHRLIVKKKIGIILIALSLLSTVFLFMVPVIIAQIQHCDIFTTVRGCSGYASIGFLGMFILILVDIPFFAIGLVLLISAIRAQEKQSK